ncbi:MFS transporter [Sporomusa malonica]|uniref:MFS transporter, putative metabolite transport protein n=1 Tax=Sporomusa malonica TaxID=112901 RepID=A0A1W1YBN1_9FIRM|nr:MFS transporter [Sporomusa malonica]SMC33524.1 MFS transporter, putative metabolite transport protein [Sporomusa malonica]
MKNVNHSPCIEDSPLTPFLRKLTVYTSGGPFLDGYILTIIGMALLQLEPELQLDALWTGMIGAAALIGLLVGGAIFGYVTDLTGRQFMYQIDLVAIIIISILQMFISTPWELVILRFLIGIAVGADYPIATSLLTEFSPRKYRGAMMGLLASAWYAGAVVAGIVGYLLLNTSPDAWRWMLGSAALPALILVTGRWGTPESPRWLVSKGRTEEALSVIKQVYGTHASLADLDEPTTEKTRFSILLEPEYLRKTLFVGLFWTFQVAPCFAIYTFAPQILDAFHLGSGNEWIIGYAVINIFFLTGTVASMSFVNRFGRRPLIIWSFVFMTLSMLLLGLVPGAPAWLIFLGFAVYAFFSGPPSALDWIYPNELFPTNIRASAVGVVTAISRIGAAIGTFALPYSLQTIGIGNTMLVSTLLTFLGLIVCIAWAPETRGLTLKETSTLTLNKK